MSVNAATLMSNILNPGNLPYYVQLIWWMGFAGGHVYSLMPLVVRYLINTQPVALGLPMHLVY
jgi:hypothetical protein